MTTTPRPRYRGLAGPIRHFMAERGIQTISELAGRVGYDRSWVSQAVNGRIDMTWELLTAIARELEVRWDVVAEPIEPGTNVEREGQS